MWASWRGVKRLFSWPMAAERTLPSYQVPPTEAVYSGPATTPACSPRQFDAGLLPQAQQVGVLAQGGNPHPPAGVVEEDVAGVGDGLGDGLQPVGLSLLAVEPALGLGAVVVGVPAGVQNLGLRGEVPLLQGRRGQ